MSGYLSRSPTDSRDTGGRKYFTAPVVDRIQRMGQTGLSQFDQSELTSFLPRFDSPPFPIADMLVLSDPSGSSVSTDLTFAVGDRKFSAPIIFGEYSFGATQDEVHRAVAQVALANNFVFGVGEGGVAPSISGNQNLMVQVATGLFGVNVEMLRNACIISIKMSQSAKIGMGGHLPRAKATKAIRELRGMPEGVDILSDASRVFSIEEVRAIVSAVKQAVFAVKQITDKPVFIKVGASHTIEHVAAGAARAGAEGIIIDGLGGGTGAAPNIHRDHIGMPIELAVHLAHKQIQAIGLRDKFKIIAGGRVDLPSKAFKLMLLGADGVLLGTASLVALGCKVVNLCHRDCPTALTAIPQLEGEIRKRELDVHWAAHVLGNFFTAYKLELAQMLGAFGFTTQREALGRVDLLHGVGMPSTLARLLDVETSGERIVVPATEPQRYFAKLFDALAETGKPVVSSMGRTTDLDPPYSHLDYLSHDGRTVVGPAYDSHREKIELLTRLPGTVNIGLPVLLKDTGQESLSLASELNTLVVSTSGQDSQSSRRKIISIAESDQTYLTAHAFDIRQSSGVLLSSDMATPETIRHIKMLSPSTPIYAKLTATQAIREDAIKLAKAGVSGIIIEGSLNMSGSAPIDIAISQADDALSTTLHNGSILRRNVVLIADTTVRNTRDIYALTCLGANAVLCDPSSLISKPSAERQLNLMRGISAELRLLMAASGLSMMSSIVGNRNILRADHYIPDEVAEFLGVEKIGL